MDLRDFFDNLEEKLMNFEHTFIEGILDQKPQNIRPRDLMLKNSHKINKIDNFLKPSNSLHSQGQSIFQEFLTTPNVKFYFYLFIQNNFLFIQKFLF